MIDSMTVSFAKKPIVSGTPASEKHHQHHDECVPRVALVQPLEIVELVGFEAVARQQQDHAERRTVVST
jgi:hypothetical protein